MPSRPIFRCFSFSYHSNIFFFWWRITSEPPDVLLGLQLTSVTLLNSNVLHSIFPILDESSSDENSHDVEEEETTCQESSSNKDIGHDVNSYQLQNRSPFYSTGERNLTAFFAFFQWGLQTPRGNDCFQYLLFHLLNLPPAWRKENCIKSSLKSTRKFKKIIVKRWDYSSLSPFTYPSRAITPNFRL